jgi:hypothetical protein
LRAVLERWGGETLLLCCSLACLLIAQATCQLERANHDRGRQLQALRRMMAAPAKLPLGPITQLDGLYARRLECVLTTHGRKIVFAAAPAAEPHR